MGITHGSRRRSGRDGPVQWITAIECGGVAGGHIQLLISSEVCIIAWVSETTMNSILNRERCVPLGGWTRAQLDYHLAKSRREA
jgi:hypothetical protein